MSYRMAQSPSINHLLLISTTLLYIVAAAPAPLGLPDGLPSIIPACAVACFESFLSASFDRPASSSLQSLCSQPGADGFTLGEGAVQCLVAERALGYCSGFDASDAVINRAYYVCYGQPNALTPTHTVITATLAVPQFGTGQGTLPPTGSGSLPTAIPASGSDFASLTLPPTLVIDPTPRPARPSAAFPSQPTSDVAPSRSQTLLTFPAASKTATDTAITPVRSPEGATGTGVPEAATSGGSSEKKSPSSGKVAGVVIGVIAGVSFLAVGIALLLRYYRRKSFNRWSTAHEGSSAEETWKPRDEKRPGGNGGTNSWITNQLRAPVDPAVPSPKKSYSRASWRPSAIGLAISPAFSRDVSRAATPTRPLSKLLPAKPILNQSHGPTKMSSAEDHEHLVTGVAASVGAAVAVAASGSTPPPDTLKRAANAATAQTTQGRDLTGRDKPHPPLPKLQIQIPSARGSKVLPPAGAGLESTVTEFEEDERISMSPGGLIWRPPSVGPMTATTYYVADKNGNWVLGDPKKSAEMQALASPLASEPKTGIQPKLAVIAASFRKKNGEAKKPKDEVEVKKRFSKAIDTSSPRYKAASPREQAASPRDLADSPARRASTIRLVDPSDPSSADEEGEEEEEEDREEEQQPFAPRPLFSAEKKEHITHRRAGSRSLTHPRVPSSASDMTSASTVSEDSSYREVGNGLAPPPKPKVELSPVAEALTPAVVVAQQPQAWVPNAVANSKAYDDTAANANGGRSRAGSANTTTAVPPTTGLPARQQTPTVAGLPLPARQPLGAGTMSSGSRPGKAKRAMGPRPMGPDDRGLLPSAQFSNSSSESVHVRPLPVPVPRKAMQPNAQNQHDEQQQLASSHLPSQPSAYRQNPPPQPAFHHQQQQRGSPRPCPAQINPSSTTPPPQLLPSRPPHRGPQPPFNPPDFQRSPSTFKTQLQEQPGAGGGPYPQLPKLDMPGPILLNHDLHPRQSQSQPRPLPHPQPQRQQSPPRTSKSPSPSLLAKRLGADRAANMALPTNQSRTPTPSKWNRRELRELQLQQQLQQQQQQQQQHSERSKTPKPTPWVPRLTPTKRGEEMFLSVQ